MDYTGDIEGTERIKKKKKNRMRFKSKTEDRSQRTKDRRLSAVSRLLSPVSFIMLIVLFICFLNSGCHRPQKAVPETMLTGHGTIAADEALKPLINTEVEIFQSFYHFASIDCKYVSEYDAINLLLKEKIRLAIVTRPLNKKESEYLKSINIVPESIPIAYDAVAVIVNSGNTTKALTTKQLSQILSGELSDWNQIENSGKVGSIQQFFDSESSGIIRSLNDSLHLNNKITGKVSFSGSSDKLIDRIASDVNGIGFVGLNWLSESENLEVQAKLKKVNFIAVSKAATADSTNSYTPSLFNMYNLRYPLIRKVYAIYTDPSASLARGFLAHLTSDRGQKIIYRIGLKPEHDFQRLVKINIE